MLKAEITSTPQYFLIRAVNPPLVIPFSIANLTFEYGNNRNLLIKLGTFSISTYKLSTLFLSLIKLKKLF